MLQKILRFLPVEYETTQTDSDKLIIEIGSRHIALIIKNAISQKMNALEIFDIENDSSEWFTIFDQIKQQSSLLNKTFLDIHCYYNFEEAIIMPEDTFSSSAAEDYLGLIFGERSQQTIKYEPIFSDAKMITTYRLHKSLHEAVSSHFLLYKPHHIYSIILAEILQRPNLNDQLIKIQFYQSHFIFAFVKNQKLQIIQSFPYKQENDVLYCLVSLVSKFEIHPNDSILEVSGVYEKESLLHSQCQKMFGQINFDIPQLKGYDSSEISNFPLHYFAPFYNLAV